MYDLCCIFLIRWKGFCVYNQICFSKFPSFSFCRSLLYATSENTFRCVHSFCGLRKDSAMFRLNKGGRLSMVVLTREKQGENILQYISNIFTMYSGLPLATVPSFFTLLIYYIRTLLCFLFLI